MSDDLFGTIGDVQQDWPKQDEQRAVEQPPTSTAVEPLPPAVTAVTPDDMVTQVFGGQALLGGMFSQEEVEEMLVDEVFPRVDKNIQTDYRCPCCGYAWSGNPKPATADLESDLES